MDCKVGQPTDIYLFPSMDGNKVLWETYGRVSDVSQKGDRIVCIRQKYSL